MTPQGIDALLVLPEENKHVEFKRMGATDRRAVWSRLGALLGHSPTEAAANWPKRACQRFCVRGGFHGRELVNRSRTVAVQVHDAGLHRRGRGATTFRNAKRTSETIVAV